MENVTTNTPFPEQRKLVAVMFADMTGYTAMMQEDESRAKLLRNRQRQILNSLIPTHHGTILQYFGDGALCIFESSANAVRCGIAIQNELQKEPKVKLRIGIHSGDVVYDKEGLYGDCVNIASRIESLSVPGAVLFSAKVHDEIKNQKDLEAKSLGKFHLKNVHQPIEVYAASNEGMIIPSPSEIHGKTVQTPFFKKRLTKITALTLATVAIILIVAFIFFNPQKVSAIDSIAVLPLENLSGDPSQKYFVDGMHETLITELSKIGSLKVISRTSTIQYKDTKKTMPEIARELNVKALIEGSVIREGDKVRITVQLIDGIADKHIWAREFNQDIHSILTLYSDVAKQIASEIKIKLTPQDTVRLVPSSPVNARAYEYYLIGRHYWNNRTMANYKQAVETYKKALEEDSAYAPAYAALADCYMLLGEQGGMPMQEARILAEAAINKALQFNKDLAEAYSSKGNWKLSYEWNWAEAENAFKKAIELNPGYAVAYQLYGRTLGFIGRYNEALTNLEKASELDPLSPVIPAYTGQVYLFKKDYKKSEAVLQEALKLHPNHNLLLHNLGELYVAEGSYDKAIAPLQRSADVSSSFHYKAILALAYAKANHREKAESILKELLTGSDQQAISGFNLALIYLALGNKEEAIKQLENGYGQRDVWMKELKAWPWFDDLRNDPRYKDLVRRMNFP